MTMTEEWDDDDDRGEGREDDKGVGTMTMIEVWYDDKKGGI